MSLVTRIFVQNTVSKNLCSLWLNFALGLNPCARFIFGINLYKSLCLWPATWPYWTQNPRIFFFLGILVWTTVLSCYLWYICINHCACGLSLDNVEHLNHGCWSVLAYWSEPLCSLVIGISLYKPLCLWPVTWQVDLFWHIGRNHCALLSLGIALY